MDRLYERTDRPMSWTKAIIVGTVMWMVFIITLGQMPSYIIYWSDSNVDMLIDFSKNVPGVAQEGLNTTQIMIVRDIVANIVQNTWLIVFLVGAYIWQERKRKRVGGKGPQDTVKGYMSGK